MKLPFRRKTQAVVTTGSDELYDWVKDNIAIGETVWLWYECSYGGKHGPVLFKRRKAVESLDEHAPENDELTIYPLGDAESDPGYVTILRAERNYDDE